MSCSSVKRLLSGYVDGSLGNEERALVERHVLSCPVCTSDLEKLRSTMILLHNLKEVEPPPWFTQKIMAQVRREAQARGIWGTIRNFLTLRIQVAVFASICIVAFAVIFFKAVIPDLYQGKNELHQSVADSGDRHGASREEDLAKVSTGEDLPQVGVSRTRQGREKGEKISNTPIREPSQQKEGSSGHEERLAKSTETGTAGAPSVGPAGEGKTEEDGSLKSQVPSLIEAAAKRTPLHLTPPISISLRTNNLADSSAEVDNILKKLNANITRYQALTDNEIYDVEMRSQDLTTLTDRLKKIGDLRTKNMPAGLGENTVNVTITISAPAKRQVTP